MGRIILMIAAAAFIGGFALMMSSKENVDKADETLNTYASGTLSREAAVRGYNYAKQLVMTKAVPQNTETTYRGEANGGTYTVRVDAGNLSSPGPNAYVDVHVQGRSEMGGQTAVHNVFARFELESGTSSGNSRPPFMEYAFFVENNINTNGNLRLNVANGYGGHASIHANGRVNENGNSQIDGYLTQVNSSDINLNDGINSGTERSLKRAFDPKNPENRSESLLGPDEPSFSIVERIEGPNFNDIPTLQASADRVFVYGQGDFQHGRIENKSYTLGTAENPELWYFTGSIGDLKNVNLSGHGAIVVNGMINFNNVNIMPHSEILFYVRNGINCNGDLRSQSSTAHAHIVTKGGNLPFGQRININGSAVVLQGDLNFNNYAQFTYKPISTGLAGRIWEVGSPTEEMNLISYRETSEIQ